MSAGYQFAPQDQVVRTNMEVGTARARLRSTAQIDHMQVEWILTDAEMATFRTWFYGDGASGTSWFTINLPVGKSGLTAVTARFTEPFAASLISPVIWKLQGKLEVRYA
jgi:hypothetical protein